MPDPYKNPYVHYSERDTHSGEDANEGRLHPAALTAIVEYLQSVLGEEDFRRFTDFLDSIHPSVLKEEENGEAEDMPPPFESEPLVGGGMRSARPPHHITGTPPQLAAARSAGAHDARSAALRHLGRIGVVDVGTTSYDVAMERRTVRERGLLAMDSVLARAGMSESTRARARELATDYLNRKTTVRHRGSSAGQQRAGVALAARIDVV
jgi:hypothetical protein